MRWGLLALFRDGPKYGYQLRSEFEARTGGTWALNVGQVYTTLERLHRDGLIVSVGENVDGRAVYTITDKGEAELSTWFATPVAPERARSELAIKLAIAATTPDVDVAAMVQAQRASSMDQMRDYTKLRRSNNPDEDLAWLLLLDHLVFSLESEMRWLDHVEATVLRVRRTRNTTSGASGGRDDAELPSKDRVAR